jgi:pyruvate dehydrogenase E2 component (dihydrolipoamide acetyltransferase)
MVRDCTVPDLGENVESATVVEVLVQVGSTVELEQAVLSLETDKAEFEMPTNVAGKVTEILVKRGDDVRVGQAVLRVDGASAEPDPPKPRARPDPTLPVPAKPSTAPAKPAAPVVSDAELTTEEAKSSSAIAVGAPPSVRRLARELGVDLAGVRGGGRGGRVSADDVTAHVREGRQKSEGTDVARVGALPDFSRFGAVDVEPMSKVRLRTAEQMSLAWSSIPHVTHHDKADVSELDRLRRQYAKRVEKAGGKLTMTAVLLKVLGSALRKFSKFNASVDMANRAIVYKRYVHVGVAVDTERGLLVPVIRDVDKKNIVEISLALKQMSEKARNKNIKPEELQGASFTITNLGGIGGTAFSPLINPPEVAVLGVASAAWEQVYVDGKFEPRLLLPLSVSYDHRVIDGADAARFLRWVCEALAEPFVMDLEGE